MAFTFSSSDYRQLNEKGIAEQTILEQLNYFEKGFPTLNILKPASVNQGIIKIDLPDQEQYILKWEKFLQDDKRVEKFVPASGAASRMFKDLFSFLENEQDSPSTKFEKVFFDNIHKFAFSLLLNDKCISVYKKNIDELISENEYKKIVHLLLDAEGLNYGNLPKGLLLFHSKGKEKITPLEEHLVEGALYAKDKENNVYVHFTISSDHQELFNKQLDEIKDRLEESLNASFHVSFSIQKPSTDTVAVDMENKPFIDAGELLFRPGGHGALIENLNDLESDVIYIKNIDNVVPDKYKRDEVRYKMLLGGVLIEAQKYIFKYIELLNSRKFSDNEFKEINSFIEDRLFISIPLEIKQNRDKQIQFLAKVLNRPIRVCGMVKNIGEPGGGPFIVENKDGSFSPQILEGSQLVTDRAIEIGKMASHFNPVDLVCAVKNYKGEKFNLLQYVDKDTGFISSKSKSGRTLKALELPGLWNGAMSDWNTIFVEVPISTFNPVKTVNDLLRSEHQ